MTEIVGKLKKALLDLRKARDPLVPSLAYAVATVEMIGKNDGSRVTTDPEAAGAVQKMIVKNTELLANTPDPMDVARITRENEILESVLPAMVSEDDVRNLVRSVMAENPSAGMGDCMSAIKHQFGAAVNMKSANQIVRSVMAE